MLVLKGPRDPVAARGRFAAFARDDSGAVSTDLVVLGLGIVLVSLTVLTGISGGTSDAAEDLAAEMSRNSTIVEPRPPRSGSGPRVSDAGGDWVGGASGGAGASAGSRASDGASAAGGGEAAGSGAGVSSGQDRAEGPGGRTDPAPSDAVADATRAADTPREASAGTGSGGSERQPGATGDRNGGGGSATLLPPEEEEEEDSDRQGSGGAANTPQDKGNAGGNGRGNGNNRNATPNHNAISNANPNASFNRLP